jgi:hypothetical protein
MLWQVLFSENGNAGGAVAGGVSGNATAKKSNMTDCIE